jgi:hypothetical protein
MCVCACACVCARATLCVRASFVCMRNVRIELVYVCGTNVCVRDVHVSIFEMYAKMFVCVCVCV